MQEQVAVQTDVRPPLFSGSALRRLIIPLVIEQFLAMTIGMADTMMVTSVGEHAVPGHRRRGGGRAIPGVPG